MTSCVFACRITQFADCEIEWRSCTNHHLPPSARWRDAFELPNSAWLGQKAAAKIAVCSDIAWHITPKRPSNQFRSACDCWKIWIVKHYDCTVGNHGALKLPKVLNKKYHSTHCLNFVSLAICSGVTSWHVSLSPGDSDHASFSKIM